MKLKTLNLTVLFLWAAHLAAGALTYEVISNTGFSLSENGGECVISADAAPGFSDVTEAQLIFRSYCNEIEIWSSGDIYEYGGEDSGVSWLWNIELSDITAGVTTPFPCGVFSITPAHIYQIDLHVEITVPETEEFGNGVQAQTYFYIIPEPAAFLLLTLGGLLIRKR